MMGCNHVAQSLPTIAGNLRRSSFDLLKLLVDQSYFVTRVQSTRRLARTVSVKRNCTTKVTVLLLCSTCLLRQSTVHVCFMLC